MTQTLRVGLAVALATICVPLLTFSTFADSAPSPKKLQALLERYDREPDGPARYRLGVQIDAAAHQKYATVSRLFWHTDLDSARAEARELARPILHLRMLGRLDEDLSCANSRLFRATLYANRDISRFLREHFVLYWSSERPVPRVTIDYGDGRTLERTVTGNSAHYVLDEDGHVLDVLPGLYAPIAFRRELEDSLRLAERMRGKSDEERRMLLVAYHQQLADATQRAWERLPGTPWIAGERRLLTETRLRTELAAAERATFAKAAMELRDLRHFAKGLAPEAVPEDQTEMWSAAGQVLYDVGDHVLDEASRALIVRLHDAVPGGLRTTAAQTDAMIARLEQSIVADSALNQLRLRPQISREIVRQGGDVDFPALNAWLYAQVFRTPRQDAWLGLLPRDVFTGVPGDGLVYSK